MTDRNRVLVPDSWSLVRESPLNTVRKDAILNTLVSAGENLINFSIKGLSLTLNRNCSVLCLYIPESPSVPEMDRA